MNGSNVIEFDNAQIIEIGLFKNFEGRETPMNNAGNKYFTLIIDSEEQALNMLDDGWNVKKYVPADPNKPVQYHIQVAVSYKFPRLAAQVYIVEPCPDGTNRVTKLSERSVGILDGRKIVKVSGTIRGSEYKPGKIKAYCGELWCTVEPRSRFAEKYGYIESYNTEDDEETPF